MPDVRNEVDLSMFRDAKEIFRTAERYGALSSAANLEEIPDDEWRLESEEVISFYNAKYAMENSSDHKLTDEGTEGLVSTYIKALDHMKALHREAMGYKIEMERAEGRCAFMENFLVELGHNISSTVHDHQRKKRKLAPNCMQCIYKKK